jgi:hypothetical protein
MHVRHFLFVFSAILLLAACAGRTVVESDLGIRGAPDWVNEGSQALNDQGGRLIHGVGQAPAMDDPALQISTADNRARAEIARVFSTFVDMAANDYVSAAATGGERASLQQVSQQIRNSTQVNLSGARIIAHWKDKRSGTVYSLAELDMQQVKGTLGAARDMNEDVRRYLDASTDNIFDRLVQEKK